MTALTRAEIEALTPEQLRLAVAELMGLTVIVNDDPGGDVKFPDGQYYYVGRHYYIDSLLKMPQDIPYFPSDIAAAWTVLDKAYTWSITKATNGTYEVIYTIEVDHERYTGIACDAKAEIAISRAALLAESECAS